MTDVPEPQPEGVLIRRARLARGLSLESAAARLTDMNDGRPFSGSRWSQLETGYRYVNGVPIVQRMTDARLAQMAYIVGLDPGQLEEVGRVEAAHILRELERQKRRAAEEAPPSAAPAAAVPPDLAEMARYFRDESVPLRERQRAAERFFRALPYFMRGEAPPREFLDEEGNPGRETA